jgi:hypothetical protein
MPPEKPPEQRQKDAAVPRPQPPVVEREPLTVTVLDTPAAEPAVQTGAQVQIPERRQAERWRGPSSFSLLVGLGAVLLFTLYRLQYAPLILRFEHGLQRRIMGERTFQAHREPQSRGVAIRP